MATPTKTLLDLESGNQQVGGTAPNIPFFAKEEKKKKKVRARRRRGRVRPTPTAPPAKEPEPIEPTVAGVIMSKANVGVRRFEIKAMTKEHFDSLSSYLAGDTSIDTFIPANMLPPELKKSAGNPIEGIQTGKLTPAENAWLTPKVNKFLEKRTAERKAAEAEADKEIAARRAAGDPRF